MYKLIGGKKSRGFRVLWLLEELGVEYEEISASPQSEEVRALNPSGKIPCFLDGEDLILDSVAILQYLSDKHGKFTFPAGTIKRAQQDSFMQFACDELDGTLWTAARNSFILPKHLRVPAIKDTLKWEYARSMKTWAQRMGDNEFLVGDTFTIADIVTAHCGTWAKVAGFESGQPVFDDYVKRMTSRPAYKAALAV